MKKSKESEVFYLRIPSIISKDARLNSSDIFILCRIISWDNEKGCFAHNQSLANSAHCSVAIVRKSIKKLEEYGYIISNENNGRGRIRRVREDLTSYKREVLIKDSSPAKTIEPPLKKDTHIYKERKEDYKEKEYSIEEEQKIVQKLLNISFPDKWDFYKTCKSNYSDEFSFIWDKNMVVSFIDLCNKLYQTYSKKLKPLTIREQTKMLLQLFNCIIIHQPSFFTDSLPKTFLRFWNPVIQNPKLIKSIDNIMMGSIKYESKF